MATDETVSGRTLDEMRAYYRARAAEYDEWWYRRGRYDQGPAMASRWFTEAAVVETALDGCDMGGDVLELAPGTGIWTERLARAARSVTAVDASPEMIAINRARVASDRVSYVLADLFAWRPDRTYDAAFCGFWLSHVPRERLDIFLSTVTAAVRPGGTLFFIDSRREPESTARDQRLPDVGAQVTTRHLNDGRAFEIVKVFYEPAELVVRFAAAGWSVDARATPTYFIYGRGTRL